MTVQVEPQDRPIPLLPTNAVVIKYPLTLGLEIKRDVFASANTGHFTILNLQEKTRRRIFHDRFDTLTRRGIILKAGYQDGLPLPTIFQGTIQSAYSFRRGPDWVTEITAFDGGDAILNGQASLTVPAGWDLRTIIGGLMGTLPGVGVGAIGNVASDNSRGLTLCGNSWGIMQKLGDGADVFIDNGKAFLIQRDEYAANLKGVPLITSRTGLLGTPMRHDTRIDLEMLFEPRATVGQLVEVDSLETINNNLYKIIGVSHQGQISAAVDGGVVSKVSVYQGAARLKGVS